MRNTALHSSKRSLETVICECHDGGGGGGGWGRGGGVGDRESEMSDVSGALKKWGTVERGERGGNVLPLDASMGMHSSLE